MKITKAEGAFVLEGLDDWDPIKSFSSQAFEVGSLRWASIWDKKSKSVSAADAL